MHSASARAPESSPSRRPKPRLRRAASIAPMTIASPSLRMPRSSPMPERSTSVPGCASRSRIAGDQALPAGQRLARRSCASSAAASATLFARCNSNAYMCRSPQLGLRLAAERAVGWIACHTRCGDAGMSMRFTPTRDKRVVHGVHQRRRRADRAGLAAAFRAERIVRARRDRRRDLERRQVHRARQRIVHEAAGQQLAALAS